MKETTEPRRDLVTGAALLAAFGVVEVAGTMWCGKTWTSLAFGRSVTRVGLAGPRTAAEADPGTALLGARPHVIDEWQDVPAIWDEVRTAVDASGNEPGSFVLTGSSEPRKELVHESARRAAHGARGRCTGLPGLCPIGERPTSWRTTSRRSQMT